MNERVRIPYIVTANQSIPEAGEVTKKAHSDDAAYDLRSAEDVTIAPGDQVLINTGLALAIPEGYAALVMRRSGLAVKRGITTVGTGLIDPGYRGDIGVVLWNTSRIPFEVHAGDRIAQLLFIKTADVELSHAAWLPHSERADGGFGSTGVA